MMQIRDGKNVTLTDRDYYRKDLSVKRVKNVTKLVHYHSYISLTDDEILWLIGALKNSLPLGKLNK